TFIVLHCCVDLEAVLFFFFSSRRRHTRSKRDWSSDVCSSDLQRQPDRLGELFGGDLISAHRQTGVQRAQRRYRKPGCGGDQNTRSEERRVGKECNSGRTSAA